MRAVDEWLARVLFITDMHSPYHDKRAINLMEKVALGIGVNKVICGGDAADFYAVSTHNKDPKRRDTFFDEVKVTNRLLRRIEGWLHAGRMQPIWLGPQLEFLMGNHEFRLDRYIQERAPEMDGIVSADGLLGLSENGWKVTAYKDHTTAGKLYITHDIGKAGASAVKDAMNSYQDNIVINHLHRIIYLVEGNAKGTPHVAACFGWLGDVTKVDYMHRVKANRDWALGFGIGYLRANGFVYLQPVPIIDYTAVVEGRLFTA